MNEQLREELLASGPVWDMVIVGGGITGAGLLVEAVKRGLRVLLLEQKDYAWGTSSRSSKLVHGGLRYLAEGKLHLTRASIVERQKLLKELTSVTPLPFLAPIYSDLGPKRWKLGAGLVLYDILAATWNHRWLTNGALLKDVPTLRRQSLKGAYRYWDAQADDARMVLNLIAEAKAGGGHALNYVGVVDVDGNGVKHITVSDAQTGHEAVIQARCVVCATGVWAAHQKGLPRPVRPLRGSHLVFPSQRFPVGQALTLFHPGDGRPVFALPWEGVTLFGTTDLDHEHPLDREPRMARSEQSYLFEALDHFLPDLGLEEGDVLSSFSGVRPVLSSDPDKPPSRESRDHLIWEDRGVFTITGGKLTTFRKMARDVFQRIGPMHSSGNVALRQWQSSGEESDEAISPSVHRRFGSRARQVIKKDSMEDMQTIGESGFTWAELKWSAQHEQVHHLDDLLLRRTRIGNVMTRGGIPMLSGIRKRCLGVLGWSADRWEEEVARYEQIWQSCYAPPGYASRAVDGVSSVSAERV